MKAFQTKVLSVVLAGIGISVLSPQVFSQSPPAALAGPAALSTSITPVASADREQWRKTMSRTKLPKSKGCFHASYPNTTWEEISCHSSSPFPNPPVRGGGSHSDTVGDGVDFEGQVSGLISSSVGSFVSVSPSTVTETGPWGSNAAQANAFTLQLNTQFFSTPVCGGRSGCIGWQQFIFSQNQCSGPCIFMEYWLIDYGTPCPSATWNVSGSSCWFNSAATAAGTLTAAELQGASLTGTASGGTDTVVLSRASGEVTAMATDSVLDLEQAWTTSEFNVFGDCCSTEANFSPGTTLVVSTAFRDGSTAAPACVTGGTTAETNNLTRVGAPSAALQPSPAILFTESNTLSTAAACAAKPGAAVLIPVVSTVLN